MFSLVISQCERQLGVMEHVLVLKQGAGYTKKVLKDLGWTMMDQMQALPPIDECPFPDMHLSMNIILWNCRGALNPNFHQSVENIISYHSPSMMIITKTRVGRARAKKIIDRLPFDGAVHVDTVGYAGGIWILWLSDVVGVSVLAATEQEIHAVVKVHSSHLSWLIFAVYASPRYSERKILWDNLDLLATLHHLPWLLLGDFTEILSSEDKLGGRPINLSRAIKFQECLNACDMVDLGFHGPRFMWANKRDFLYLIQERIDRCFANPSWKALYPEAFVQHLTRLHSDHCPVLLSLKPPPSHPLTRPFKFQPMWLSHPLFNNLVQCSWNNFLPLEANILHFTDAAKVWNKEVFGNIFHRKVRLEARIKGTQSALASNPNQFLINLERQLTVEYSQVLNLKDEYWNTKSRYNWIIQGDRNIAFFHTSTLVRRGRNKIVCIKDNLGNWVEDPGAIANVIRDGFSKLFSTERDRFDRFCWYLSNWTACLTQDAINSLSSPISNLDIKAAVWSIKPSKDPGPDGLHAGFFQHSWATVGDFVCKIVQEVFQSGSIPAYLNHTPVVLIPKCQSPEGINNFRPISLCNTTYKIITKLIVMKIRPFLDQIISPLQSAFVPGRRGMDNMIIVQELVHTLGQKKIIWLHGY